MNILKAIFIALILIGINGELAISSEIKWVPEEIHLKGILNIENIQKYSYNDKGLSVQVEILNISINGKSKTIIKNEYDDKNALIRSVQNSIPIEGPGTPSTIETFYKNNSMGKAIKSTTVSKLPNSEMRTENNMEYDENGRLIMNESISTQLNGNIVKSIMTQKFDSCGNVVERSSQGGKNVINTSYIYRDDCLILKADMYVTYVNGKFLTQSSENSYNEKGKIIKTISTMYRPDGKKQGTTTTTNEYDSNDLCIKTVQINNMGTNTDGETVITTSWKKIEI